ncbi:MAG: efflux RND transporter permease subunit [Firmicutes bacterium]|nr:efflux RND transporter permease subunit [Bacillota bacterium]
MDLFPDINLPVMAVSSSYPGAAPEEVEQQVTRPLEGALGAPGQYSRGPVNLQPRELNDNSSVCLGHRHGRHCHRRPGESGPGGPLSAR